MIKIILNKGIAIQGPAIITLHIHFFTCRFICSLLSLTKDLQDVKYYNGGEF